MARRQIDEHGIQQELSTHKEYKTAASVYLHSPLPASAKTESMLVQATMPVWAGGWDTTAFGLTQCAYYVLQHPEVLRDLKKELEEAWSDATQDPSMEMLGSLPYLHAVVSESLRLMHGALCRITRVNPAAPEQYGSYVIPPGTRISMSIPDINLDTSIWGSDAHLWRPERWLPGHEGYFGGMEKYLKTFSQGTRVCAGVELAWVELKLITATLFRRFDMRIDEKAGVGDADIVPWVDGFTPGPKSLMQRLPVLVERML